MFISHRILPICSYILPWIRNFQCKQINIYIYYNIDDIALSGTIQFAHNCTVAKGKTLGEKKKNYCQ